MSAAVALRDAVEADLRGIADVLKQATRTAYTFMAWTHDDPSYLAFVTGTFPTWSHVRVAEADGRIVGFACLEGDLLDQLFVLPDWQGRGVGGRLLDDVKALKPAGFTLYTFEKNLAARRFYARRGLVETGRGFSEEEQEADVAMRWTPTVAR